MAVVERSLNWQGQQIDGANHDDLFIVTGAEQGIAGLDLPQFDTMLTPRSGSNGAVGGIQKHGTLTLQTRVAATTSAAFLRLRQSMKPRPDPYDELPLSFDGFGGFGGDDGYCLFVRPAMFEARATPADAASGLWIADCGWVSSDGLVFTDEQAVASYSSPASSRAFEVANPGLEIGAGPRAFEFRMTANGGPLVNPRIRVDHADGTFEQITVPVTMTSGQVLTFSDDGYLRVGQAIRSVQSLTEAGIVSRSPRWWRLLPSDGDDEQNVVTMTAQSGNFTGFCKTRGVW